MKSNDEGKEILNDTATKLEDDCVHKVYEEIANHFSRTRHTPWPNIKTFVESLQEGQFLLDIGCGNGKYFGYNSSLVEVGCDMSQGLLQECRTIKGSDVIRSNALNLPFKDDSFDAVLCIAMLHHLSTKKRRIQVVQEICRVLIPEGESVIYVWAKNQQLVTTCDGDAKNSHWAKKQMKKKNVETLVNTHNPPEDFSFLPVHGIGTNFSHNDMLVPWKTKDEERLTVHFRYYHLFDEGELEELIKETNCDISILKSYYDQGNWCVRFKKLVS